MKHDEIGIQYSTKTAADQTAEFLRGALRSGRWREHLPSERALSLELRVSRPTLRKALEELEREGMLAKTRGHSRRILKRRTPGQKSHQKHVVLLVARSNAALKNWHAMALIEALHRQLVAEGARVELIANKKLHWANAPGFLKDLAQQYVPHNWVLHSQPAVVQRWFMEQNLPAVVLGSPFPGVSLPFVDVDLGASCRHAVGVLARLRHRRICYFSRTTNAAGDFLSEQGFEESRPLFNAVDIQVVRHDGSARQMWNEARRWKMQGEDRPTALLTSHWEDALALMVELLTMGISVPGDVSIISRDPSPVFERMRPRIASYIFEASRHASAMCRLLHGGKITSQWLIPKFDKGESLSPPLPPHSAKARGQQK